MSRASTTTGLHWRDRERLERGREGEGLRREVMERGRGIRESGEERGRGVRERGREVES